MINKKKAAVLAIALTVLAAAAMIVLFKGQARHLRFNPEDGLQVICRGQVTELRSFVRTMRQAEEGSAGLATSIHRLVENFERARLWSGLVDRYRAWVLAS